MNNEFYAWLADALNHTRKRYGEAVTVEQVASRLALEFTNDPGFDPAEFMRSCGYIDDEDCVDDYDEKE